MVTLMRFMVIEMTVEIAITTLTMVLIAMIKMTQQVALAQMMTR